MDGKNESAAEKITLPFQTPSSKEIAERQLSHAISLYLERGDLICSITLAGAAEEILGKIVQKMEKQPALEGKIERLKEMFCVLFPNKSLPPDNQFAELQNLPRNMMKHLLEENKIPQAIDLDDKAGRLIQRAIQNHVLTGGIYTPLMRQFEDERLRRRRIANET